MPARKPSSLINRHETKAETRARARREAAARPRRALPLQAPAQLANYPAAQTAWRYLMRRFEEAEGEIVSGFDLHLVLNFCMAVEQLAHLNEMRATAYQAWLEIAGAHQKLVNEKREDDAVFMAIKVVGAYDALLKLDTRVDRKVDLLHKLGQSMYLTPRARAGVAPAKKEPEEPPDELEQLLGEALDSENWKGNG